MAPLAMDLVRVEVGRRDSECILKVSTIAEQSQEEMHSYWPLV